MIGHQTEETVFDPKDIEEAVIAFRMAIDMAVEKGSYEPIESASSWPPKKKEIVFKSD